MCLIALLVGAHPDTPLVVAANRDELLERESRDFGVLRAASPRLLGGQDARAGGTWLAIGEHGVIAGLTNRPQPGGMNPSKRSRGQLPLLMANQPTALEAVAAVASLTPAEFNPCYLVVADRTHAFYVDFAGGDPTPFALPTGLTVLENRPLGAPSAKVDAVKNALAHVGREPLATLAEPFTRMLRSHDVPPETAELEPWRPPATRAPCVHAGPYGTRSSTLVWLPNKPSDRPHVFVTNQAPCLERYVNQEALWLR